MLFCVLTNLIILYIYHPAPLRTFHISTSYYQVVLCVRATWWLQESNTFCLPTKRQRALSLRTELIICVLNLRSM